MSCNAIEEANVLKNNALERMRRAHEALRGAQEDLTYVEGDGSAEAYSEIAELYQSVETLMGKIHRIKPTGIFN